MKQGRLELTKSCPVHPKPPSKIIGSFSKLVRYLLLSNTNTHRNHLPGLADVARASGVGLATASRALNQSGSVKPATRAKVLAAAEKIGYVSRPALAALASMRRSGRSKPEMLPIAILTRARNHSRDGQRLASQMQVSFADKGYRFEGFDTLQFASPQHLGRRLHHAGFVGVILIRIHEDPEWFDAFPWQYFAVVSMDSAFVRFPVPIVRTSEFQSVYSACEKVRSYGYDRLGMILASSDDGRPENLRRLAGAWAWQSQLPPKKRLPISKMPGTGKTDGLERELKKLLSCKPNALICFLPSICLAVRKLGVEVPLATLSGASSKGLSGMASVGTQRQETVTLLDRLVRSASYGLQRSPVHHLVEPEWIDGLSLPVHR